VSELRSTAGETLQFEVGPVERDDPPFEILSSSSALVTTVEVHGYQVGDHVRIEGHLGNPINGTWVIGVIDSTTSFTLSGTTTGLAGGRTGAATRQTPIDLTLATTEVVFTAKRHVQDTDAQAVIQRGNTNPLTGIAVNSPSSTRKNMATVTIAASVTQAILLSEDLYFDVQLKEPDGRVTRLDSGIWKVGGAITRA